MYTQEVKSQVGKIRYEKREYPGLNEPPEDFAKMYWWDEGSKKLRYVVVFKASKMNAKKWGFKWDVEIYSGKCYIPGDTTPSYSRQYIEGKGLPQKYKPVVEKLKKRLNIK